METAMSYGICRCCASEGSFKDLEKSYDWLGTEEVYSDMLKYCFDISLSKQDSHNNGGICEVCITQLRNANNFKKQVQLTEQQFLKKVEEDSGFKTSIIKIEVPRPDDHDIFDDGNLSDGFSSPGDPEYDIPLTKIKIEKMNEAKPKKRTAKASTSKAKKLKKEEGEPSSKREIKLEKPAANRRTITVTHTNPRIASITRQFETFKHLANIRMILENSNATPINYQSGSIGFACCFCPEHFADPSSLKNHTLSTHNCEISTFMEGHSIFSYIVRLDITGLKCGICQKETREIIEFTKHLEVEHKKKYYNEINNHIVPFRFDSDSLYCVYCKDAFIHFKRLAEHMSSHYRNYVCEVCNAGFVTKRMLRAHGYRHKTGNFNCSLCSKVFNSSAKKRDHEWTVHLNRKKK